MRADLVFDESKLNTERIRVVWLSPNDWDNAGGFRYGNVRFCFDWATLVEGKRYYWVESIAYGIEACRILITDADYSGVLDVYDPTAGDGPWWCTASGEHYWNGDYCLEVMFEGDLGVSLATKVDFVTHHKNRCNINYRTCRFCGLTADKAGAEFLATLVSRQISIDLPGLIENRKKRIVPSWALEGAVGVILQRCGKIGVSRWGSMGSVDPGARALARSVLAVVGNPDIGADLESLAAHFKNRDELEAAVAAALADAVGLPSASAFLAA